MATATDPATFVLVHGGRLGGWCWRHVRARLEAAGHRVVTPTLTGVGERAHLASPAVDMETHVDDLVAVLEFDDLEDVVLVAHSYGGVVITGAAERAWARIAQLVYLDAIVPGAGDSAMSVNSPGVGQRLTELAVEHGDGWLVPPPPAELVLGDPAHPLLGWVAARATGQPLATYFQPLVSADRASTLPRTYIRCAAEGNLFPSRFADEARADPAWRALDIPCGHNAMLLDPDATAAALLSLVPVA